MLVLIGSRALEFHGRLAGREAADWDFISYDTSKAKRGIEISDARLGTNEDVYWYCRDAGKKNYIETPIGQALVAPLDVLKALKLSSLDLDKAKHEWDLQQLEDIHLNILMRWVVQERTLEVKARIEKQKDQFFNKYHIPRFIEHDWIHECINPVPIYTKILTSATDVCENKFNALTFDEKIALVREECFVLVMERELIPKAKRFPKQIRQIVKNHSLTNTSTTPALRWLSRLSIVSKVKDHPPWLSVWTTKHINYIMNDLQSWWTEKLEGMPVEFWRQVLK